jgi:hypothetical protein
MGTLRWKSASCGRIVNVDAEHLHRAGVRLEEVRGDRQEGGLARPVRPEQAVDRLHGHFEGDAFQRLDGAEALGDVPDRDRAGHR